MRQVDQEMQKLKP